MKNILDIIIEHKLAEVEENKVYESLEGLISRRYFV